MTHENEVSEANFEQAGRQLLQLRSALESAIAGQTTLITEMIITLIAGGHILTEGLPGLVKPILPRRWRRRRISTSRASSAPRT